MYADKCNNVVEIFNIRLTMLEKKYTRLVKVKKNKEMQKLFSLKL